MKETFYSSAEETLLSKDTDYAKKLIIKEKKRIKTKSLLEKRKAVFHAKKELNENLFSQLKNQKQQMLLLKRELLAVKQNVKKNH